MQLSRKRRLLALLVGAALLGALIGAPSALADVLTPESGGSPNADAIDTLYKIAFAVGVVIFLLVWGTLGYSLVKYRARRSAPQAEQIRGNTRLEIGWTVGAALILVVLAGVTFLFLDDIETPEKSGPGGLATNAQLASVDQPEAPKDGGPTLNIKVNGQQYLWRYDYPGEEPLYAYQEMVVPTNTTVTLDIDASDVIHSWWIPKLGGKADAVPGHTNQTWFKISKPGEYRGQCAELCGEGHADMYATVRAVPPSEFEAWSQKQSADIKAAGEDLARQREERKKAGEIQ